MNILGYINLLTKNIVDIKHLEFSLQNSIIDNIPQEQI